MKTEMAHWMRQLITVPLVACIFLSPASAQIGELTGMLTKQLGVSEEQAVGGAGALMNYVKQNLDAGKFGQVESALPDLAGLIDAVPADAAGSGASSNLASMLGGTGVGQLAGLTESFDKLGLGSEKIAEFIPVIMDYAKSRGGEVVSGILRQALPAL